MSNAVTPPQPGPATTIASIRPRSPHPPQPHARSAADALLTTLRVATITVVALAILAALVIRIKAGWGVYTSFAAYRHDQMKIITWILVASLSAILIPLFTRRITPRRTT